VLTVSTPDALRAEADGAVVEILAHPKRRALELIAGETGVGDVEAFGERVHVTLPGFDPVRAAAWCTRVESDLRAHGLEVLSARPIPPSLEDVFISRIQAREAAAAQIGGTL
jgi:hypothetical protein